jgi:NAD(P)H dehydrogenase (quinone)
MTTAVIGATGHIGSEIVHGLVEGGDAVASLVRDAGGAPRGRSCSLETGV